MVCLENYLISDYHLSCSEILQSLVVSEYGLRHLKEAEMDLEHRWGHYAIACIQFMPVLGQIAMFVEWVFSTVMLRAKWDELLFVGSQEGCDGAAAADAVLSVVNRIDSLRERGVLFNRGKVTGFVEGGVCSAMALDFAEAFFQLRQSHSSLSNFFLKTLRDLGSRFARSSEEMRIRQAAFNTIEVQRGCVDASRNKVQSLANLHGFKINYVSNEVAVDRGGYEEAIGNEVTRLPDGLYLLRTIAPSSNEKQEEHGHSMIYFKKHGEGLFYDPNEGARYMKNVSHVPTLSHSLSRCYTTFQTSRARFYRLAQNTA